jgi:hypothetical protein
LNSWSAGVEITKGNQKDHNALPSFSVHYSPHVTVTALAIQSPSHDIYFTPAKLAGYKFHNHELPASFTEFVLLSYFRSAYDEPNGKFCLHADHQFVQPTSTMASNNQILGKLPSTL